MKKPFRFLFMPWVLTLLLVPSLIVLAILQYRWVGQISQAEHERMRQGLVNSIARFSADFDSEIARVVRFFLAFAALEGGDGELQELYSEWVDTTVHPGLVAELYLLSRSADGGMQLRCPDTGKGGFRDCSWPSQWIGLKATIEETWSQAGPGFRRRPPLPALLEGEIPAIVIAPLRQQGGFRGPRPFPGPPLNGSLILLRLSPEYLREDWLPRLAERYLIGEGTEYDLSVSSSSDGKKVIYSSVELKSDAQADLVAPLFSLRFLNPPGGPGRRGPPGGRFRPGDGPPDRRFEPERGGGVAGPGDPPMWEIQVTHSAGSLEAAVSQNRFRNLVVSFGILFLLGVTVALLIVSSRRAQELARRQVEFVAGVSHELHTPLAAMRSAAQNLADGVVRDKEGVEAYGRLIEKEGQRLSEMLIQLLELARIGPNAAPVQLASLDLHPILQGVLSDYESRVGAEGIDVRVDIPSGLPAVRGDAWALRRVFYNLLDNAFKHGGKKAAIAVRAGSAADQGVWFEVEDGGAGIQSSEIPHLFESFYRGESARDGQTPGSGLGLSLVRKLVESMGGRISVRSQPGRGSCFKVTLQSAEEAIPS